MAKENYGLPTLKISFAQINNKKPDRHVFLQSSLTHSPAIFFCILSFETSGLELGGRKAKCK